MFASWAGMVDCEGRWWHQKSPYLLCSSGLALAGTWALRNAWGCCSFCTCLHHGLAWLTVRAVDDTKNHLTYFVRVDWHLPGRELSEMPEVAVVFGKDPARASRSVVVFSCLRHFRSIHFIPRSTLFSCAPLHFLRFLLCFVTRLRW